ncbi:MAG TPA: class I SAM-dependent methyltransferase [bacterium]|nr:class I SAM-dependent methyltransferase [bacterium]
MTRTPAALANPAVEEVRCPLCGAEGGRRLSTQLGRFGVVKCRRCGLVRLAPRLTRDAVRGLYEEEYYAAGGYDDYAATFERFRHIFERLFARRLAILRRYVKSPGRILECGCAHGFQLAWLRRQGWDVVGTDVSRAASAYGREHFGLEVITAPLEEAPLPPASFDAAYLVDVVEHLYDPAAALANVRRALRPGGAILVQVPYELYHWEKAARALGERKKIATIAPDAVPYHVTFFTPRTLKLMLQKCGFRVLGRHSGNYGVIRRRLAPPDIRHGGALETAGRFIYYKLGLRAALGALAVALKQGSGVIYVATPREK